MFRTPRIDDLNVTARSAMHLHAGLGFTLESPVQRYCRGCKILEHGEGANEVQREMIFKAVAGGFRPCGASARRARSSRCRRAARSGPRAVA